MQNHIIENDFLKIAVNPTGAELCSFVDKQDNVEHIWQADPKFWPRHAPILFPTIGESKGGKIQVDGKEYPMNRHGFARTQQFKVVVKAKDRITFELNSNAATHKHFPFDFQFQVAYYFSEGNRLHQHFYVKNTGAKTLGFQLGGHPAFAVPFNKEETYNDYQICFDQPLDIERHLLTDNGLFSGEKRPFLRDENSFGLDYKLFSEDAIVLKNIPSKKVWIQHKNGGKKLLMEYDEFPHFGIWSVVGADYVCLEPWIGCADHADQPKGFFKKENLITLDAEEVFEAEFRISIS
ncbi:MAG: aldose 1-epimerase family protein [Flavobacteriales bacterium]|nr:aldose 1-epimerase family protein [Flavobacteriales bacterium]